jgi:hypothetical protein
VQLVDTILGTSFAFAQNSDSELDQFQMEIKNNKR